MGLLFICLSHKLSALPLCRALVEVKPMFYTGEYLSGPSDLAKQSQSTEQDYLGHDICLQKCVAYGKICTAILSVTEELAAKICSLDSVACPAIVLSKGLVEKEQVIMIARFCISHLDKVLSENNFSWDDVMVSFFFLAQLFYFTNSPGVISYFYL